MHTLKLFGSVHVHNDYYYYYYYVLLATMTHNQVQSFQINDYANHYVDIEITGYIVLYSEMIAGRAYCMVQNFDSGKF